MSIQDPGVRPGPWNTAGDHEQRIRKLEATPGGEDETCVATIDSTENVGDDCGVHSVGEPAGLFLKSDGADGSTWGEGGATAGGAFAERIAAQPSLVGWWPMDDESGDAHDETANAQDLDPVGTPTYGQPGALATSDQTSILLAGTDGTGTPTDDSFVGSYAALNLNGGDMTVMFLIYPTSYPALSFGGITAYGDAGAPGIAHLTQIRDDGQIFWSVNATQQAQSGVSVPLNVWTHVACVRNSSNLLIYFNGVLVASGTTEAILNSSSDVFRVGVFTNASNQTRYFKGRIAHVALFNDDLSANTIAEIASSGVAFAPGIRLVRTMLFSNATLSPADEIVLVNGALTATLPTAVGYRGKEFTIKNQASSGSTTIARTSSQTIDGTAADLSLAPKDVVTLMSDGANWQIMGSYP